MADDAATGTGRVALLPAATEPTGPTGPTGPAGPDSGDVLLAEELLVEEISIDGMCGVY